MTVAAFLFGVVFGAVLGYGIADLHDGHRCAARRQYATLLSGERKARCAASPVKQRER